MKQSIPIAFVTDSYWPSVGGIEQAVSIHCSSLPEEYSPVIITQGMTRHHKLLADRYIHKNTGPERDPDGNRIHYLDATFEKKTLLLPLFIWNVKGLKHFRSPQLYDSLYQLYRFAFKSDLQKTLSHARLVHSYSSSWPARLASEICKAKNIPIIHSPPVHFGRWGDSPAQLKIYTEGNAVTCFTQHFKNTLYTAAGITDASIMHVIPPVIEGCYQPDPLPPPVDKPFILFLGRREQHKGLPELIDAFTKIESSVVLVIAGPGEKIKSKNKSIVDLGEISHDTKLSLLNNCEFLVLPTHDESFGIVFTEAMSSGKPCVAFDIPPVNEIVQNETTGLLVECGDTNALASAMQKLTDSSNLRITMGNNAKNRFDTEYSSTVTIKKIVNLYSNVISNTAQDL